MKRKLSIILCLLLLASGVVRIGVSVIMIGQTLGWWALGGEASEALADTQRFIADHSANLVGFTPLSYFGFIAFMGLTVSLGALGHIAHRRWGIALLWLYCASHAALFVNFMAVNPKIAYLALAVAVTALLMWLDKAPRPPAATAA